MHTRGLMCWSIFIILMLLFYFTNDVVANDFKKAPYTGPKLDRTGSFDGCIPLQIDLSHLKHPDIPEHLAADLPIRFDWREQGAVTPIKNQGDCGSCYAFAFLSCFESKILIDQGESLDLSENNIKECNWYESSCNGGADWVVASYLNAFGTVLEANDPYVASDVECSGSATKEKVVLEWNMYSDASIPSASALKDLIYNQGPVISYMYIGDSNHEDWWQEFSDYDGSYTLYFQPSNSASINHLVTIVGWDDELTHDGGQGAWIIKNSWGDSWGGACGYGNEGGYCTIAYGSAYVGQYISYIGDYQDYDENGQVYRLDEGGWNSSWGTGSDLTTWGMCKYEVDEGCLLDRVEFWTNDWNTTISVRVYDTFNGSTPSDMLTNISTTVYEYPGLHSAQLDSAIQLSVDDPIFVAVRFANTSNAYPVPADSYGPAAAYKSYISVDGSADSWVDLGGEYDSDIAIRIRCNNSALYLSAPDGDEELCSGTSNDINWSSTGNISNVKLDYSSDNGTTWNLIESSVPNTGSYSWTVPYAISTTCLVRISDAEDGVPSDISSNSFIIYCPIWPGDLDASGLVDAEDILPLAQYWYDTGSSRDSVSYSWLGQSATPWDPIMKTYADADGSGRIDIADFYPICLNWNKTHDNAVAPSLRHGDYDIENNRDVLLEIYNQVADANAGAELEIKEFLSRILELPLPLVFKLEGAYPNPFNNTTTINYTLAEASQINLSIYNVRGQLVNMLVDDFYQPGQYQVKWDGDNSEGNHVASGVYFVKLQSDNKTSVKTMSLIK